jgi:hypothetical protein
MTPLTTHVVVTADATRTEVLAIKARARELLDSEAFEHVTVDIEKANHALRGSPMRSTGKPTYTLHGHDARGLLRMAAFVESV